MTGLNIKPVPPLLAQKLLRLFLSFGDYNEIYGDLIEVFQQKAEKGSLFKAKIWLYLQVLKSIPKFLSESFNGSYMMTKNYLKIALRNLLKHKSYSLINVVGLSIGLSSCILILLYVNYELSYEKHFDNYQNIYRVSVTDFGPDGQFSYALTPPPLAATLQQDFAEVLEATRISRPSGSAVKYKEKLFDEERICFADANFFKVFSHPFLIGDSEIALSERNSVVITSKIAEKYFGGKDAFGESITIGNGQFKVTGVIENPPPNSHFYFDFLMSFVTTNFSRSTSWGGYGVYTYAMLQDGTSAVSLESKFPEMVDKYYGPQVPNYEDFKANGNMQQYDLTPAKDIHLTSDLGWEFTANGNEKYVYMLFAVSLFILLIACVNFMNLATARSAGRAKEIGVRKVLGSQRTQLIRQFLIESTILSVFALAVAIGFTELILPYFNSLISKELAIDYFGNPLVIPGLVSFAILVGFFAGSYPAFFLSRFHPIVVLKGKLQKASTNAGLRSGLVVFQFSISIILLITTGMFYKQMDFMLNKDMGFTKDQIVVVDRINAVPTTTLRSLRDALKSGSDILGVTTSESLPGTLYNARPMSRENAEGNENFTISMFWADYDYVKTFDLELVWGRDFSRDIASDTAAVILNEAAVKLLGWDDPENKRVSFGGPRLFSVIGVLKDFHYESLHNNITPLAYTINRGRYMAVRVKQGSMPNALSFIKKTWDQFNPNKPIKYSFLDEGLVQHYRTEEDAKVLFQVFASIAIIIGCLGLFGLAAFTAEQKTKEIGVRKVLGATDSNILLLLSKEFMTLIGIAFIIAALISYYGLHNWLQTYAYHTDMSVAVFIIAGLLTVLTALFTVGFQSIKAAMANPVDSLKYE